jgi:NADPH-dependent 2,4-dienoyl-CoA reductase/sulfur reductase-like enzyme
MHLLIIGGSDAGISAALRARELDPSVDTTVVVADAFPNFSICGLPFYLSGEVGDYHNLAHRTAADIEREGIRLLLDHTARTVDPEIKSITVVGQDGQSQTLSYDKLVIGTGAVSAQPQIAGLDLPGVYPMRWMRDAFAVYAHLSERAPRSAVVIGGGYIGMEMADGLTLRGLDVTVVEYFDTVLTTVDPVFGQVVCEELEGHGVQVATGAAVERIEAQGDQLVVSGSEGLRIKVDLVVYATGVRPETALAQTAGVDIGEWGAIRVNRKMETNVDHVYAAGDCVETWHRLLHRHTFMPLGTTAHKQGRVAGENAVGGDAEYAGSLGTQVVKVFDLVIARTGLRDIEASEAGFDPLTVELETWDHKVYYPGAHKMRIRVTGDRETGQLLGAQMIGRRGTEVSKRIDVFATALFHGMAVDALSELDLSYTPPLSSPWDPVQMAAQAWGKALSPKA